MDRTTTDKKPVYKLVGTDGNAFAIMGKVSSTLKKSGASTEEVNVFLKKAMGTHSYNEMLQVCMDYVDVE